MEALQHQVRFQPLPVVLLRPMGKTDYNSGILDYNTRLMPMVYLGRVVVLGLEGILVRQVILVVTGHLVVVVAEVAVRPPQEEPAVLAEMALL